MASGGDRGEAVRDLVLESQENRAPAGIRQHARRLASLVASVSFSAPDCGTRFVQRV